jgi:hypothetical protein
VGLNYADFIYGDNNFSFIVATARAGLNEPHDMVSLDQKRFSRTINSLPLRNQCRYENQPLDRNQSVCYLAIIYQPHTLHSIE